MFESAPARRRSDRHTSKRERRRGLIVLVSLLLVLVAIAVAAGSFYVWATGASGPRNPIVLTIPQGVTGAEVADLLKQKGVIRSTLAFRLLARFRGPSGGFEFGKYRLTTNMTAADALNTLKDGPFVEATSATFPEGLTIALDAVRVHQALGLPTKAFVAEATSGKYSLPPYLPAGSKTVEGFLFPDTYDFLKDARASEIIQRLLAQFRLEAMNLPWGNAKSLGITPYQAVIVASLVEREARYPPDREKIAAVIYNRLRKGMLLQIDATVQYALGHQKSRLTYADLRVASPYNTYLHRGLPPTPIASPGLASLRAALTLVKYDYLYFVVVDPKTGRSAFTASYREFLRLKAQAQAQG